MRSLLMFVLLGAALAGGCATGKESTLKPSMVSREFRDLDDDNPFDRKGSRVSFLKVGIKKYDAFFQDAAEVKGTVIIADVVLKESDSFIASIKKDVRKGKVLTPAQAKRLDRERDRLASLTKLLGDVPGRSGKLLESSENLAGSAAKTFIGPDAVKLSAVVEGLRESAAALKDATAKSPGVLQHAGKTSAALAGLN